MENRNKILGINRKTVIIFHKIMLFAMFNSIVIAPCQAMIQDAYGFHKQYYSNYGSSNSIVENDKKDISKPISIPKKVLHNLPVELSKNKENEAKSYYVNADINEGVIGVSNTNPLDDVKDNLFKFYLKDIPSQNFKAYLTYDLFGVQDFNAVSRSINDRPATGGYIIKNQKVWTSQKEEIDINWLRTGENKFMFGIPNGANYQYQIKNVKLEFDVNRNSSYTSTLVINNSNINFIKDNQLYIKGFLRNFNSEVKVIIEETPLTVINGEYEGFLKLTDAIKNRKFVMVKAYDDKGLLGQELLALDNLQEADKLFSIEEKFKPVVSFVKARTNAIIKSEGASIKINDSALVENKEISISKIRTIDIAPMSSGLVNVTKDGLGYRFLPDGTLFENPVSISLEYDEKLIPKGYSVDDIKTFYFNTNLKTWIAIERDSIIKENKEIVSLTNHFTDYVNGIIQTPESPETAGFTPTMMNDVKAADPSAEMTIISPPEVSQKGDANVSYPIKIPAGRKGMQPQLAVQYSNEGGNSWLGQGWNLTTPAITIDTKWGVPILDPNKETEIYLLNGEQLMYPKLNGFDWMPNRHYNTSETSTIYNTADRPRIQASEVNFTPRKQGSFSKIVRLGNSIDEYYWKVISTDGTISWYGGDKDGVKENTIIRNNIGNIIHWGLCYVEDVHGNCIKYTYDIQTIPNQNGQNENLNGGKVFHVKNILYNGFNDDNYKYEITFLQSSYIRNDVTINARLGIKQIEPYLLQKIYVKKYGSEENIRSYYFKYGEGKFGKKRLEFISERDNNDNEFYNHTFEYYNDIGEPGSEIFFSSAVEINTCNDNYQPCPDADGDKICDENDLCPNVSGSITNNGCPVTRCSIVINSNHDLFEYLMSGMSVYINGNNMLGVFNNFQNFVSALQNNINSTTYTSPSLNNSNHVFVFNQPNVEIKFIGSGHEFLFSCVSANDRVAKDVVSDNSNRFQEYFKSVQDNYSYTFQGVQPTNDDPDCPSFTNYDFTISGNIPSFDSSLGILGTSTTKAESKAAYLGVGVGCKIHTKSTTFGLQGSWSKDKSFSKTALVDINGDGLDDVVIDEGDFLYYKQHLLERTYNTENEPIIQHTFGPKKPISGINNFYNTYGKSSSTNFQITFGVSSVGGFFGLDKSKNDSTTNIFFSDANADGLMDIVKNGVVYFNRLDPNKNPEFNTESKDTENMVIIAAPASIEEPAEEIDEEIEIPSYDVVKVWEAPADGTIKIDNNIVNTDTSKEAVVTVEKSAFVPVKCYSVSFPLPTIDFKDFDLGFWFGLFFYTRYSPQQVYLELRRYIVNGTTNFQTPTTLFMSNGNENDGYRNDCQSFAYIDSVWLHDDNNTNYITSNDFIARHNNYLMPQILNNYTNTSYTFGDYYAAQRGTDYNPTLPCYDAICDVAIFNSHLISASINQLQREYAWTDHGTVFPLNSDCTVGDGPQSYIPGLPYYNVAGIQNFPFSESTLTIPTTVAINNISISNATYDLSDTNQFNNFVSLIHNLFPGSTITNTNDVITITVSDTNQILDSITLSANGGTSNTYAFSEINCNGGSQRISEAVSLSKTDKNDWKNYICSKDEMEYLEQKFIAEGSELKSIKLMEEKLNENVSLQKFFNETYIQGKYKVSTQKQQEAQEWINNYYKQKKDAILKEQTSRIIDVLSCNEIPDQLCLLFGANLNGSNATISNVLDKNCEGDPLTVRKGDRIYFRVHSIDNGNPAVNWDPKITYTDANMASILDQNGLKPYESSYSDGFILSRDQPSGFPAGQGLLKIDWPEMTFDSQHFPSDDVTFEIIKKNIGENEEESETVLFSQTLFSNPPNNVTTQTIAPTNNLSNISITPPPITGANLNGELFYFRVSSNSNVDWKFFEWKPIMRCNTQSVVIGENGPEGSVSGQQDVYPIVNYSIYKSFECSPSYSTYDITSYSSYANLRIKPDFGGVFNASDHDGDIWFVVKHNGKLVGKRLYRLTHDVFGQLQGGYVNDNSAISLSGLTGQIEIGFYVDENNLYDGQVSLLQKIAMHGSSTVNLYSDVESFGIPNSNVNLFQKPNPKFGPMLRQWGQFMYNPNVVENAIAVPPFGNLIQESELIFDESLANSINDAVTDLTAQQSSINESNIESFQNTYSQLYSKPLLVASPYKEKKNDVLNERWIGLHGENYAASFSSRAAMMEQSFSDFYEAESYEYQNMLQTGAYAINKVSRGKSTNLSAGGSASLGSGIISTPGANGSTTLDGRSSTITDYIDFNGDRYPDLVSNHEIQFTKRVGGLFEEKLREGDLGKSSSSSSGLGAQGSFSKGGDEGGSPKSSSKTQARFESFKGNSGGGLSINFSNGDSKTKRIWTDINGDGLADMLEKSFPSDEVLVTLNYGYSTESNNYSWALNSIFESESNNIAGGLGINKWNGSLEAGISLTSAWNSTRGMLNDMNGDGLIDYVSSDNQSISVKINTGNKFNSQELVWSDRSLKRESVSVGATENLTASFSLVWYIPLPPPAMFFCLKLPTISLSHTLGSSTSNTTKKTLTDFDGDGYPDIVEQTGANTVKVYSSNIRRTDMLKTVHNPLGGSFTIDYKVQPVDYNNPHPKWVMSNLIIEDGYDKSNDGYDKYYKRFIYENGKYDRRERDFYGYETVKVQDYSLDEEENQNPVYRTFVSKYYNDSYYLNGLLKESYVLKGEDESKIFSKTENIYQLRKLNENNDKITSTLLPLNFDVGGDEGRGTASVVLATTKNYFYELATSPLLISQTQMEYDEKGRIVRYFNNGNVNDNNDDYYSLITYHDQTSLADKNIINIPSSIKVYIGSELKRSRYTKVEEDFGDIIVIGVFNEINGSNPNVSETNLKYDEYGNLINIDLPMNHNEEVMSYAYHYDEEYHKYIVGVSDSFGYNSATDYDSNFDKIIATRDKAGNQMIYEYDSFGRTRKIIAPKELEDIDNPDEPYTIKFDYYPEIGALTGSSYECITGENFTPFAVTYHYDKNYPHNDIQTISFVDGLGRPIQVKKDIEINTGSTQTPQYTEAMSISGKTWFDEYGRTVKQFHPYFESLDCGLNAKVNEYESEDYSSAAYDELDRVLVNTDEDDNQVTNFYSIATNNLGVMSLKTKTVTQQNNSQSIITESYKDVSGKVISTNSIGDNTLWTQFLYSPIGELMNYTDAAGYSTTYTYDLAGRKKSVNHPDFGLTSYEYDPAGNLIKLQTPNLANNNSLDPSQRFIKYIYDYNRLFRVVFPNNPDSSPNISNVEYAYGNTGNNTGRLILQQDATGIQEFSYGNMGEVISNTRTVVGPNIPTRVFVTEFEYDSWNRLKKMVYPDGEKVLFGYNKGGNLNAVVGQLNANEPYRYIKQIDYDYYEQKTYMLYGNNSETFYSYTPSLRRLDNLKVKTQSGENIFNNYYQYDKVGNVLSIENTASNTINGMAGAYTHNFEYDEYNRLHSATGIFQGDITTQQPLGNDFSSAYTLSMEYNSTHGIQKKAQKHYKNGDGFEPNSYTNNYEYTNGTHMLRRVTNIDSGYVESFAHDANGNMTEKIDSQNNSRRFYWDESNRLRVVKDDHDMQHYIYDASGERVLKANTDVENVYENGTLIGNSILINGYTSYPSAFLVIDHHGIYTKHYYAGSQRIVSRVGDQNPSIFDVNGGVPRMNANESFDPNKLQKMQINDLKKIAEKLGQKNITFREYKPYNYDEVEQMLNDDEAVKKNDVPQSAPAMTYTLYYYHPDHLGTSTALTDFNGNAYQFFLNLPFGETMAEQLGSNYYNTPYKFNGKELDEETGLYYYGARYYDPRISVFLSVDPLAEKYPNISPYVYCINNPINVIDPDGRDIIVLSHGPRGKTSIDGGKTNAHPHIVGHMAVLIGNDKTGWTYLSYDYDKGTNKGRGKSGDNDVYTIHKFDKLSDFKNSEHNTFKDDYDDGKGTKTSHRDADGNIIQRYQDAFQIKSDAETDAKMIEAGSAVFDTKWTQVKELGQANQCTTVAEKALDAGGFNNGEMTPYIKIGDYEIGTRNYLPAAKQKGIEKRNTGTDVDSKIQRTGGASGSW